MATGHRVTAVRFDRHGDFNADGKADVFAVGTGKGGNWNTHLTGGATQYGTVTTATGAIAYADAATGDFNRDGYADVALNYRDASGIGQPNTGESGSISGGQVTMVPGTSTASPPPG